MMDFLILESGIISNIICCDDESVASKVGAVPSYENAKIGDLYNPPELNPTEPAPTLDERVGNLEEDTAELHEALDMILTGVTE